MNSAHSSTLRLPSFWQSEAALIIGFALLKLMLHVLTNSQYGFHRDEFYYLVGGQHLAWGYVDHPPVVPALARLAQTMFGDSLSGLRLFPALAGAFIVALTGLITREMRGGRFAQVLAMLGVLLAPLYLGANAMFQTVSFDQLGWVLSAFLLARLCRTGDAHLWLLIGMVIGLALLTKYTIVFFGFGLTTGLLLTNQRAWLRTRWPYVALILALVIAAPNFIWQFQNGFPTLEFLRNSNAEVRNKFSVSGFLLQQVLLIGPLTLSLCGLGLYFYFTSAGASFRILGVVYLTVLAALLVLTGKPYYLGPAYPMLFAAGAIALNTWLQRTQCLKLRSVLTVALIFTSLPPAVFGLPILPTQTMLNLKLYTLNKDFAEMLGWDDFLQTVSQVYNSLPQAERATAIILTQNYGEAGAIDVLGARLGLPSAISGQNSYFFWRPNNINNDVVLAVGYSETFLRTQFGEVALVAKISNHYNVPNEESAAAIYICRAPKITMDKMWGQFKHFN